MLPVEVSKSCMTSTITINDSDSYCAKRLFVDNVIESKKSQC